MNLCNHRNPNFLILICFFITSCYSQTPQQNNSTPKSDKIVLSNGTQSGVIGCELMDKDGNIWFSIKGEGAYRFDGKLFTHFTTKDGLCNNNVGPIIQDRAGNILLGTNNGICKFDGNAFSKYPVPDVLSITCMLEDKDGNLWFGTSQNGVYCYNGKTLKNFLNSNRYEYNLGSNNQFILDILQDKEGNLWFSSWNGGGVWKYDGSSFTNFVPPAEYYKTNQDNRGLVKMSHDSLGAPKTIAFVPSQDYISDDMIFSMTEDNAGNIWFATRDHGLCRYNGKTFLSLGKNDGFNSRGATAILQDNNSSFWITTVDKGVWYYDGKTFTNLTEKDGLVNDAVMSMLKDKQGNLWFGTKYLGLSRYDGKTFTTFSKYNN